MARCARINPRAIWRCVLCAGALMIAAALFGCGRANSLVGTWKVDSPPSTISSRTTFVDFRRDGTVTITDRSTTTPPPPAPHTSFHMAAVGTYSIHSDQLTIQITRHSFGRDLPPGQAIVQWFKRTFTGHPPPSSLPFGTPGYKPPPLIFTFHRSGDTLTLSRPALSSAPAITLHRA